MPATDRTSVPRAALVTGGARRIGRAIAHALGNAGYDVAMPGGRGAVEVLQNIGHAVEFLKDSYRHCKPILVIGAGATLLESAGGSANLTSGEPDPGVLSFEEGEASGALQQFVSAIAKHRHFAREVDPPLV